MARLWSAAAAVCLTGCVQTDLRPTMAKVVTPHPPALIGASQRQRSTQDSAAVEAQSSGAALPADKVAPPATAQSGAMGGDHSLVTSPPTVVGGGSTVVVSNVIDWSLKGDTSINVKAGDVTTTAIGKGSMAGSSIGTIGAHGGDLIPIIPWPPPQASARADITSRVIGVDRSHGAIDRRLREILGARGYSDFYYFTVPTGGFVVMTRAERVDDAGKPLDKDRWLTTKQTAVLAARDYARKLLFGDDGRLRILAFVVSAHDFLPQGGLASDADIQRWRSTGQPRLSQAVAVQQAPKGASVTLLVYEFQLDRREARQLEPVKDGLPIAAHLASLGMRR